MRYLPLCLLLVAARVLAAGEIVNPSFNEGLRGWTCTYADPAAPGAGIDRTVFRGGDMASLAITTQTGRRGLWFQGGIPRDPRAGKYRFNFWVRCRDLGPDWIIRVALVGCQGEKVIRWLQNTHLRHEEDMDWTPVSIEAAVPPEMTQLGLYVGVWYSDALKDTPPPGGGTVWYDDLSVTPSAFAAGAGPAPAAAAKPAGVTFSGLWPEGEKGLFLPGQPLRFVLLGDNPLPQPVTVEVTLTLKDFADEPAGGQATKLTLEPGKLFRRTLEVPAPGRLGAYVADTTITRDGKQTLGPQSSCCLVSKPGPTDPYFVADVNGQERELVPAMQLIGVSGRKVGATMHGVPPERRGELRGWWQEVVTSGGLAPYCNSSLNLIGNIFLGNEFLSSSYKGELERRRSLGLFPYPDACFEELGRFVEGAAQALKGRVHYWVLSEEIDGSIGVPNLPGGSQQAELTRYVMMSRIAYQALKRVDPDCEVIGLAVSGDFNQTPRWPLVRRLLPDLKDYTDIIGPDLYTDSWNWPAEVSRGPEAGQMRDKLQDTIALQRSLGKKPVTAISERGYGMAYHLPPDHPQDRLQAQLTARSLILGKSVGGVLFYTLHMMCGSGGLQARAGVVSDDLAPKIDLGLWQSGYDKGSDKLVYRPRSAVAAYATVARLLAGSTTCTEVLPQTGVYSYTFQCPGHAVTALWTTDEQPLAMNLTLPVAVGATDLMGNEVKLAAGAASLTLTGSPQFLSAAVAPEKLAEAVRQASFPGRAPLKALARLKDLQTLVVELVNQSAQPLAAKVQIGALAGARVPQPSGEAKVPASGRASLPFALSGAAVPGLGELRGTVQVGLMTLPLAANLALRPLHAVPGGLKIDGDLREWPAASAIQLDRRHLLPSKETPRGWSGPDDLGATVYLGWDARRLYVAARVRDDVHLQNHVGDRIWMDDCLQLAFDLGNDALPPEFSGRSGYDASDYNLAVALTSSGPQCYCFVDRGGTETSGPRDYPLAARRGESETCYEWALDWPQPPGKLLRLSFVIFDVDSPAEKQAEYWLGLTGGIANGQDPSQYGVFALVK